MEEPVCFICYSEPRKYIIDPCGHNGLCKTCVNILIKDIEKQRKIKKFYQDCSGCGKKNNSSALFCFLCMTSLYITYNTKCTICETINDYGVIFCKICNENLINDKNLKIPELGCPFCKTKIIKFIQVYNVSV